jgi:methylmalonyl-CoA mutase cobalamin-binding domain/chain
VNPDHQKKELMMPTNDLLEQLKQAVIEGDEDLALQYATKTLQEGFKPLEVVKNAIQPAMDYVGDQFQEGEAFLPELIMAGDAATSALSVLMEELQASGESINKGTIVLGVMFGDNHDIGKNVVKAVLSANGFKVIDIGVNMHPKAFIETAIKEKADIIAASTLMTTSLPYQRELVTLLNAMEIREDFFVILGGGPVTPTWTKNIGADGYGRDAKDAVELCTKLMAQANRPPLQEPIIENPLGTLTA